MKTFMPTKKTGDSEKWYVVDAGGVTLGRLATSVAGRLMGKGRPTFAYHVDVGEHVIVVNASQVKLTGKKWDDKTYYRHTGYPGGLKQETARELRDREPGELVTRAVAGMLPKTKLGKAMIKKLKVYGGAEHPHQAQVPEPLTL